MFSIRVRLPLLPHFALIGLVLGVGSGQWAEMTAAGVAPAGLPVQAASSAVLVSVSTLDMRRLVPSQFGDWDAPSMVSEP